MIGIIGINGINSRSAQKFIFSLVEIEMESRKVYIDRFNFLFVKFETLKVPSVSSTRAARV